MIFILLITYSLVAQGINVTNKKINEKNNNYINNILFDLKISFLMKHAKLPSLSACVIKDYEVLWSNSYGFYDLDNRKSATENTIYNLGSISKTITGTALMQLWEQGLFDLDEDVNNYLPFSLRNPNFPDIPITFRMLLSHSSSLNPELGLNGYTEWINFSDDPPFSFYPYPWLENHLVPGGQWYYSKRWNSTYRPGEYSMYANANFDLVAYLVELISEKPFLDYCRDHIFLPLEMFYTGFNLSKLNIDNVAIPYHYHDRNYLKINELYYILGEYTPLDSYWRVLFYPVGGLYSTVSDLSHFFIAHMNGGIWNGVRILTKETVEEMHRIQPPGNMDRGIQNYGLAWIIMENPLIFNITISGYSGDTYGVSNWMIYIPSEKIGVIYFSNGDRQNENFPLFGQMSMIFFFQLLFKKANYNLLSNIRFGNS